MGKDDHARWMEMYVILLFSTLSCYTLISLSDVILAAADVEGNFLVVKVSQPITVPHTSIPILTQAYNYTDLLSCLLLDAYVIPL